MKGAALFVASMALCLLVIPMIALESGGVPPQSGPTVHSPAPVPQKTPEPEPDILADSVTPEEIEAYTEEELAEEDLFPADALPSDTQLVAAASFLILDESTGKVEEVSLRDFVRGAVAAEMPASFEPEALKAQAVAAHTFALHSRLAQQDAPDPALYGADFAADPSNMKVYAPEDVARAFYGDHADEYWEKICEAADSVLDCVLAYDDEPIVAAYHAISSGSTEDAANIWIGDAPYLKSVHSEGDRLAPGYTSSVTLSADEVKATLQKAHPDIALGAEETWFGAARHSDSGYVSGIAVGGIEIPGKDIRTLFGLRSHAFEVQYAGGEFTFTVTGYGHGVGLSQYGANYLAQQGLRFDEILETYYTGASLHTVDIG